MKKKKFRLNLGKQTISGFDKARITGGTNLSQLPDGQSICLCGPPATVVDASCFGSFCEGGSCEDPCSVFDCVPPDTFKR